MHCHICDSKKQRFFMKKDGHILYRCSNCQLVFVWPQPSERYLSREVYSATSIYQSHRQKNLDGVAENRKHKNVFTCIQKHLSNKNTKNAKLRLLDVGCSNGVFLYHAQKRGFESYGVELNERTARIAQRNGLTVFQGTLTDAKYGADFFDIVFLGDILEHVPNPAMLLIECRRVLKRGGILIVSTPNTDCFWSKATLLLYKFFKIPWSTAEPPYHLWQFSLGNLKYLLSKVSLHFLGVEFGRPPTLKYELGSLHLWGKFKKEKNIKNFLRMLFGFSLYTILYGIDILSSLFKKKDFSMTLIYNKA